VFEFSETRSGENVREFLRLDTPSAWKGTLVTDGFSGYRACFDKGVTSAQCMAHARRKFHELWANHSSEVGVSGHDGNVTGVVPTMSRKSDRPHGIVAGCATSYPQDNGSRRYRAASNGARVIQDIGIAGRGTAPDDPHWVGNSLSGPSPAANKAAGCATVCRNPETLR